MARWALANRLALLFALIVAGAIGVVYGLTVPQLEDSLREDKLDTLSATADANASDLSDVIGRSVPADEVEQLVREIAARSKTRVTVLSVTEGTRPTAAVSYDSETDRGRIASDPQLAADLQPAVAEAALVTGQTITATEPTEAGRVGEAAVPLRYRGRVARIVVFTDSLAEVRDTVGLVRRRFVVAGIVSLLLAAAAGYLVARALSVRVRRLERAARQVAEGDFKGRIEVDSDDELGQLAQAFAEMQAQLAQLDSARSRFIATASHELRTPIFSLGGFLELLDDEELDEDTRREFVGQVRGQVERLHKLATELLDLSRMQAGSFELRTEPTDLARLVREVSDEFAPVLASRGSEIQVRVGREPLEADCDPNRVAQVMRILLDNAVVHTPEGTDIMVSAARVNGTVRLAVSDRGLGIERQAMSRIFEPFFKSDDAPGAGLGLAIAHELAERMDGRLEVESRTGNTRFWFELPS